MQKNVIYDFDDTLVYGQSTSIFFSRIVSKYKFFVVFRKVSKVLEKIGLNSVGRFIQYIPIIFLSNKTIEVCITETCNDLKRTFIEKELQTTNYMIASGGFKEIIEIIFPKSIIIANKIPYYKGLNLQKICTGKEKLKRIKKELKGPIEIFVTDHLIDEPVLKESHEGYLFNPNYKSITPFTQKN